MSELRLPEAELAELERRVTLALETGNAAELEILGYGEISCVIGVKSQGRELACKRLPLFRDASEWEQYEHCFSEYLEALRAKGVRPLDSVLQSVMRADGTRAAWCVQPRLAAPNLLSNLFHTASESDSSTLFERVVDAVLGCVAPTLGLDGQLSNWILLDGELHYLDVTTPMLRSASGAERLPLGVFLASLPWAVRGPVRRFMLHDILDKYYEPRGVVLDLLGNLYKEKLSHLLPGFIEQTQGRVSPQITIVEAERYYASDAGTWALLQRLRHADRWWQRRVRRRVYPFLLPGRIER